MIEELQKTLQRLIDNEVGKMDALFHSADGDGMAIDPRAIQALLIANELDGLLRKLQNQVDGIKQIFADQLVEQFALLGVQSMNLHGQTVFKNVDRFANAKPECRQQLVAWARENDLDDMIVLQPQRFKSWCREQLEGPEGALPDEIAGMVEIFEKASLRIRKG